MSNETTNRLDDENNMGWLALRILNVLISNCKGIPKNLEEIDINHPIVNDIGFQIAQIYTEKEIVVFLRS